MNDLATKKPFTVDVNTDSQLHKLSPMMAQGIAMRLKGGAASPGAPGAAAGGAAGSGALQFRRSGAGQPVGRHGKVVPPASMVVSRRQPVVAFSKCSIVRPVLELAELKKGDAVMVLATEGGASRRSDRSHSARGR